LRRDLVLLKISSKPIPPLRGHHNHIKTLLQG